MQSMLPPQWRLTCALSSSSEQTLRNLVNRSVRRITEMYRDLDRRLKSTAEKERKVASNREERDLVDTHDSTHITLEQN